MRSEKLSKKRLEAFESGRKIIEALNREICEMRIKHKTNISHLNAQLENERFNKGIFEQKWKNAEEELMKLRESLPKRDSKGRFCKR
jgi:pyruvate carboxylase